MWQNSAILINRIRLEHAGVRACAPTGRCGITHSWALGAACASCWRNTDSRATPKRLQEHCASQINRLVIRQQSATTRWWTGRSTTAGRIESHCGRRSRTQRLTNAGQSAGQSTGRMNGNCVTAWSSWPGALFPRARNSCKLAGERRKTRTAPPQNSLPFPWMPAWPSRQLRQPRSWAGWPATWKPSARPSSMLAVLPCSLAEQWGN